MQFHRCIPCLLFFNSIKLLLRRMKMKKIGTLRTAMSRIIKGTITKPNTRERDRDRQRQTERPKHQLAALTPTSSSVCWLRSGGLRHTTLTLDRALYKGREVEEKCYNWSPFIFSLVFEKAGETTNSFWRYCKPSGVSKMNCRLSC